MLPALRRRQPIERAAGELPGFWPSFSPAAHFAGKGNPMAIPGFYRGMAHRIGIISTLPLVGEIESRDAGVPIQIIDKPDPAEDRQTTIARMEASLILRGEYVCVLGSFDSDGYPQALKVVDPVHATLNDDGSWRIGGRTFSSSQILHAIPIALPGETRGCSVVELFRRTFTAEIAAQEYQGNFYLDGGQPTTILTNTDTDATDTDLEAMLQRYMAKVAGGRREPIALPATITVSTMGLSNSDSQFLESRQFAMTDIANIVGVPPSWIGAPGSSNIYSNLTQERQNLLDVYLRADLYAIERGFSSLLPEGLQAKFEAHSFLRMDPKLTADTLAVESQWMTIDEIRQVQGMPPLPAGAGQVIGSLTLPGSSTNAPAPMTEVPNAV